MFGALYMYIFAVYVDSSPGCNKIGVRIGEATAMRYILQFWVKKETIKVQLELEFQVNLSS